jgi:hypothetical protein
VAAPRAVLQRVENYLRSGMPFVYLQVPLRAVNP